MVKKGKTPWNKGKKGIYSEKTLKKISESGKGRIPWNKGKTGVYSKKTIEKMKNAKVGKKAWNKGLKGLQPWHDTRGLIKAKKGNTHGFQKGVVPKTAFKKGNKPWNYIDGRSKLVCPDRYGDDWSKIRMLIYERDNFTCQECGINMRESMKKFKQALHIHHKVPFLETFDNSLKNLITLCKSCHSKIECNYLKRLKDQK